MKAALALLMAIFVLSCADEEMTSSEENVEEWEDQASPVLFRSRREPRHWLNVCLNRQVQLNSTRLNWTEMNLTRPSSVQCIDPAQL